jgi:pyridoxal phosphate enzyme (YggS family)
VRLVAVTKTFAADRIRQALEMGHTLFGENRVQEALQKIPEVGETARWHMIGHLQRNKARQAVGAFELIHSVDSTQLGEELERRAAKADIHQPVLVQVNLSGEGTKSGTSVDELTGVVRELLSFSHLEVQGLMTIPPPVEDAEENRGWFVELRQRRDALEQKMGVPLPELSMGMTDDFEVAIEEGATLVRVGRALFGERSTER